MKGKACIAADGRADEVRCNYFHHAARYITARIAQHALRTAAQSRGHMQHTAHAAHGTCSTLDNTQHTSFHRLVALECRPALSDSRCGGFTLGCRYLGGFGRCRMSRAGSNGRVDNGPCETTDSCNSRLHGKARPIEVIRTVQYYSERCKHYYAATRPRWCRAPRLPPTSNHQQQQAQTACSSRSSLRSSTTSATEWRRRDKFPRTRAWTATNPRIATLCSSSRL